MANSDYSISWFAFYSRVFIITTQVLFNYLMPDHNAKVFNPPTQDPKSIVDYIVTFLFGGMKRWDAIYFLHISQHGYTYENTLAFFPLYPICVRYGSYLLWFLNNYLIEPVLHLVVAEILNICFFIFTTKAFYNLSILILQSQHLAYTASILFCLNPASIFFQAPYSETFFAFFTFSGLLSLENGNDFKACLYFTLSTSTRSNGIVNCGFLIYSFLFFSFKSSSREFFTIIKRFLKTLIFCVIVVLPFFMFQYYAYIKYCWIEKTYIPGNLIEYGNLNKYHMPHKGLAKWCTSSFAYSYIQSSLWNVGFLKYYELKQIPNFLLALPILILVFSGVYKYVSDKCLEYWITLKFFDDRLFVYIVHVMVLTLFSILFLHIQVTTRFLCCSSPIICWIAVLLIKSDEGNSKFIHGYFLLYFFVGIGAFSNFLPWT